MQINEVTTLKLTREVLEGLLGKNIHFDENFDIYGISYTENDIKHLIYQNSRKEQFGFSITKDEIIYFQPSGVQSIKKFTKEELNGKALKSLIKICPDNIDEDSVTFLIKINSKIIGCVYVEVEKRIETIVLPSDVCDCKIHYSGNKPCLISEKSKKIYCFQGETISFDDDMKLGGDYNDDSLFWGKRVIGKHQSKPIYISIHPSNYYENFVIDGRKACTTNLIRHNLIDNYPTEIKDLYSKISSTIGYEVIFDNNETGVVFLNNCNKGGISQIYFSGKLCSVISITRRPRPYIGSYADISPETSKAYKECITYEYFVFKNSKGTYDFFNRLGEPCTLDEIIEKIKEEINGLPPRVSVIDYQKSEKKKDTYNDIIIRDGNFVAGKHIPGKVNWEAVDYLNQFSQKTGQKIRQKIIKPII